MNRLVIFLNERSCLADEPIARERLIACVLQTLQTLKAVRRVRQDLMLASESPISGTLLGDGTQTLASILKGDAHKDEWRFIANLDQSSPWGAYPDGVVPGDLEEVTFRGKLAVGMTWANKNGSAVVSFDHRPVWHETFIEAQHNELDASGNANFVQVNIRNLSAPDHVQFHRALLADYGAAVSQSSLIFRGDGYVIRMYSYDHNPPHFHVLLNSGAQAKYAIVTLDPLAGYLPPGLRSEVKAWARSHKVDLLRNWARCQIGDHPLLLGE